MKKRLIDANALLSILQNRHDTLLKSGEMIVSGALKGHYMHRLTIGLSRA